MNSHSVRSLFRPLYQFVYPPLCLSCGTYLHDDTTRICPSCYTAIKSVRADDMLYLEMSERMTLTGEISGIASAFHFEKQGTLQSLIHQLKYDGVTRIGEELGKRVGAAIIALLPRILDILLVPVPLHTAKLRERGYNQSEFIARGIAATTGFPVRTDLLKRSKNTRTQTALDIHQRQANMAGAFQVPGRKRDSLVDRQVILVDDVITTGATILECARVLKAAGATRVMAASVALADHAADLP